MDQVLVDALKGNSNQWAAFESRRHCVVLAGPGSGKTRVLVHKLARMLSEDVRPPRGIACITYSNQCVRELNRRLSSVGVTDRSQLFVGTLHSFCLGHIITPFAGLSGLPIANNIQVATGPEQEACFQTAVGEVLGGINPKYVRAEFDEFRRTELDRESESWLSRSRVAPLIRRYEELLEEAGLIDFDGIVLSSLRLVEERAWVRKAIQARFPILAIDEYQDLGVPLHRLVMSLCIAGDIRLFAVGDPDQSIYGFAGSRPDLMQSLASHADVECIRLKLNYRFGSSLIKASTRVLAEDRDYQAIDSKAGIILDYRCPNGFDEQADLVTNEIIPRSLDRRPGRKHGDIGVLYLDQYQGRSIAKRLQEADYQFVRFDQGIPYKRTPIVCWLEDCASWCSEGWINGSQNLSDLLAEWTRFVSRGSTPVEAFRLRRQLMRFLLYSRSLPLSLHMWIDEFRNHGLWDLVAKNPSLANETEALEYLYKAAEDDQPLARYGIADFAGRRGSPERLNLSTIHSAKGLEYDVVIMMGLEQGQIPRLKQKDWQLREARRLFYVAMTRARHEVHFLSSGWYEDRNGLPCNHGRSQFIDEVMQQVASAQ